MTLFYIDIVRHCTTLFDIVQHCTLFEIVQHCTILYDIDRHCMTVGSWQNMQEHVDLTCGRDLFLFILVMVGVKVVVESMWSPLWTVGQ